MREKERDNNTGKENFEFALSYAWIYSLNHSKHDGANIFVSRPFNLILRSRVWFGNIKSLDISFDI